MNLRMGFVELPHLAVGAPAGVAVPSIAQIAVRDLFETMVQIEAAGILVGQRLVVHQRVVARAPDGLLVEMLGLEFAPSMRAISAPTSAVRLSKFSGQFSAQTASCAW